MVYNEVYNKYLNLYLTLHLAQPKVLALHELCNRPCDLPMDLVKGRNLALANPKNK